MSALQARPEEPGVAAVRVPLGGRAYDILVGRGLLDGAGPRIAALGARAAAIVSDETVAAVYAPRLAAGIEASGLRTALVTVAPGEASKSYETLARVCDAILDARIERGDLVVALGGGIVGDLAGFAAAIVRRGVRFVQVPTTLLAQVDSSVGGKTAINHPRGKNMVGAFHQPVAVVSDVATLDTLPDRELRAGLAEVIKHGAALDAAFFAWLEAHIAELLQRERAALIHAVRRSCELKAAIVAEDEREAGRRALLNLGHTFGHAIEAATGFGPWLHGEAVAAGMVLAADLSARAGLLPREDAARITELIRCAGLPTRAPAIALGRWHELMSVDKKSA
ncbi:MAG: 3-dehydroquinate synthase, partial [Microvirga sp.]